MAVPKDILIAVLLLLALHILLSEQFLIVPEDRNDELLPPNNKNGDLLPPRKKDDGLLPAESRNNDLLPPSYGAGQLLPSNDVLKTPDPCDRYEVDGCSVPFANTLDIVRRFIPACNRHDVCYACVSLHNFLSIPWASLMSDFILSIVRFFVVFISIVKVTIDLGVCVEIFTQL